MLRSAAAVPSVLFVVSMMACAGDADLAAGITRADSAGVKIITSGARDTVLPWTFDEIDVLRDSLGEPYLFTGVSRQRVLTDRAGRTYVLTRDPSIVRFGRDGREERSFGRKGGGPGEFEFPTAIGAKSDTIWVRDNVRGVLVRFLPDLSPTTDQRLDGALDGTVGLYYRTGGLWTKRHDSSDSAVVIALFADTLGSPPLQRVRLRPKPVRFTCMGMPFSTPLFAPELPVAVAGARLLVPGPSGYELWLYEGPRAVGSVRRPLAPRAPTADDVRALYPNGMEWKFSFGDRMTTCVTPIDEVIAQQGLAESYPFAFDVALLSDGTMWVLRTPTAAAASVVDVFGPDGVYAGTMTGRGLPLARMPNGELLFAREDAESGGTVIQRVQVAR